MVNYMNDIIDASEKLIESIKNNKEYIKYLNLRKIIQKDQDIMGLINEVKSIQKRIVNLEIKHEDISSLEKELKKKLEILNTYPIYLEFTDLQKEINIMLQVIKNTIEKNLYNITN